MRGTPYAFAVAVAAVTGAATVLCALFLDLPLRDPDGVAGPSYIRLPVILGLFFLADVLPRSVRRSTSMRTLWPATRTVVHERWPWQRVRLAIIGFGAFYVTYVSYRNLKSYLPFARDDLLDEWLGLADSILFLGADPAVALHWLLGTGVAAHVLSFVYVSYLVFVPITLAAALVWNRDIARGFWYVTALCLNWTFGALSYYVFPALGPVYTEEANFRALPDTGVSALQDALWNTRIVVLFDPSSTGSVHGVAAFASLHVSVLFTAAYFAYRVGLPRALRIGLWTYLGLTVVATVYFGWHYVVDDIFGVCIGWLSVALGAVATGHDWRNRPAPPEPEPEQLTGPTPPRRASIPEQQRPPGADVLTPARPLGAGLT